jgi:hypothetical protein
MSALSLYFTTPGTGYFGVIHRPRGSRGRSVGSEVYHNQMDYAVLASPERIAKTVAALTERGFEAFIVPDRAAALAKVKELIPAGASVMNGSSRTLEEIGYVEYLRAGGHGWNNLHEAVLAEKDPAKQAALRKQAALSDFYLGSVHALAETGEMVIASNTGSQLPHLVFTSPYVILVVGAQKIVPTRADALARLETYVVPLEDQRIMAAANVHTTLAKILILERENPRMGRTVRVILVNEKLGF